MPFLIIASLITVIIIIANVTKSTNVNNNSPKTCIQQVKKPEVKKDIKLLSNEEVVNILMASVDDELGADFLCKRSVIALKSKVVSQIERDYKKNPEQISEFVQSIDCRLWAKKMLCDITFRTLTTKKYYSENGITPTGTLYYDINRKCITSACKLGYIDEKELNIALRNLDEVVRCQGDMSEYRYHEVDNYLDNIW